MSSNHPHPLQAEDATIVAKAVIRIADSLNFSGRELAAIIGAADDKTYISALVSNGSVSENAVLFVQLHSLLTGIVGCNAGAASSWLRSYNAALEARPIEMIQSSAGLKVVLNYLEIYHSR